MASFLILGTDTDAGKTTFAMLFLGKFSSQYEYWKPLESGNSDTQTLQELIPEARCHFPLHRFSQPVAPPLAARQEQIPIPSAQEISTQKPGPMSPGRTLLIETFGSPFSPLNETELQIDLIRAFDLPAVLVSSSALGAIGRTLQGLHALEKHGITPFALVLLGPQDNYAHEQVAQYSKGIPVFSLQPPESWDQKGIQQAAINQSDVLEQVLSCVPPAKGESIDLLDFDRAHLWHPYISLHDPDPPLMVESAQDEYLHLADGRKIIDGISSWWTILHGHRHPVLMDALTKAMSDFDHVLFAGVTHRHAIHLAELLLRTTPWGNAKEACGVKRAALSVADRTNQDHQSGWHSTNAEAKDVETRAESSASALKPCHPGTGSDRQQTNSPPGRVFYSDNGSTAVEVALKMAYQFWCHQGEPQRTLFIGFENGYHGDTFGAMAASRDPVFFGRFEPLLFETKIIPVSAERLEETLKQHKGCVSAVIIEPLVQGAGGMQMHTPQELRAIFEVARRHNVLFIADEVMTGGRRLGPLWAHSLANIAPDLICASKTIAGGVLPMAATLAAPHIAAAWETDDRSKTFFHGHSFTAHPLACAVGVTNWTLLLQQDDSAAKRIETFWTHSFSSLSDNPQVREVRIRGSIAAIELNIAGGYLAEVARTLRQACLYQGVFLRPLGNVLYAMPPLGITQESLEKIAATMRQAVELTTDG